VSNLFPTIKTGQTIVGLYFDTHFTRCKVYVHHVLWSGGGNGIFMFYDSEWLSYSNTMAFQRITMTKKHMVLWFWH